MHVSGRRVLRKVGTASAKALRLAVLNLFEEQQRVQWGWSRGSEGESVRRGGGRERGDCRV